MNQYISRLRGGTLLPLTGALLLGLAGLLEAQERPVPDQRPAPAPQPAPEGRGWLGLEFAWEQRPGSERPVLIIRQVMRESPAERAEIRAGDIIRSFGGAPPEPGAVQARGARLRPGEVIVVEVLRPGEDRVRSVPVQADRRPSVVARGPGGEWVPFHPDTLRIQLRMNLDSMRAEMARFQAEMERFQSEDMQVVFRGLMEEGARMRDSVWFGEGSRPFRWEHSLVPMEQWYAAGAEAAAAAERTLTAAQARGTGPLMVFRSGQRVVGGAELAPLNPDLARYFGTESGVLAVEVLEDTPAERGGLRAGDVIIRVREEPVTGITQFRDALERGYRSPPVPVTVIREGRELELRFPR